MAITELEIHKDPTTLVTRLYDKLNPDTDDIYRTNRIPNKQMAAHIKSIPLAHIPKRKTASDRIKFNGVCD